MLRIATISLAALAALPAHGQQADLNSASVTLSYDSGDSGNGLPIGLTRLAIRADLGFADRFGLDMEVGYLSNSASGAFTFDYTGTDLFLNPYVQLRDDFRLGVFYDRTRLDYLSEYEGYLYGVTVDYTTGNGMMIDAYAGRGQANRFDLDTAVAGLAVDYDFGNGWAIGGSLDYEAVDSGSGLDGTRIGLAGSYTFDDIPLTVTLSATQEDISNHDNSFGVEFTIPIGPESAPARPADPRRGIFGVRPLT